MYRNQLQATAMHFRNLTFTNNRRLKNPNYPIALVTRQDDPRWSDFVYCVVSCTFCAEEYSITMARSQDMQLVHLFGSRLKTFQDAISAVGNYGEMYVRTVYFPRQKQNNSNENSHRHYSLFGYRKASD